MNGLTQQRWFTSAASIAAELTSRAGEAWIAFGRWINDSAKDGDPRIATGGVVLVTALAVALAIVLSLVVGK